MNISSISDTFGSAAGGKTIMIFCEKVNRLDIAVRFAERVAGKEIWSAMADRKTQTVHHQVAIAFQTPPYRNTDLDESTKHVTLQLFRPSDGAAGCPVKFTYTPTAGTFIKVFSNVFHYICIFLSFCINFNGLVTENVSKAQSMKRKRPREHRSRELPKLQNHNIENVVNFRFYLWWVFIL